MKKRKRSILDCGLVLIVALVGQAATLGQAEAATRSYPPMLAGESLVPLTRLTSSVGFNLGARPAALAKTITGKVVSETGEPLIGVTVALKGTTVGTSTDISGKFTLEVPDTGGILVFSYVGFIAQEVAVGSASVIDVVLKSDTKTLGEVVVVGYGTQKRENVVGSISQISAEQIANRPVTQLREALTGQMPGVTVTQRTGRPGVPNGSISIRGVGSFGATPSALILVDGIPVDNYNDVDPNDVETISVLKDASSAAIYGSRAANGVILITTKSGAAGKLKVSYNAYVGTQRPTAYPDFVDSWDYQQAYFEAQNGSSTLTPEQLAIVEKYRAQNDPDFPNNKFLKHVLSEKALQTGHNLTVSGGSNTNKFNLSLGYLYQDGLVVRNDYNRFNVRLNMTTSLSDKFTLTTRLAAISSIVNEPMAPSGVTGFSGSMLGIIGQAARTNGSFVAIDKNGEYAIGAGRGTPVSYLATNSFNKQKELNLNGNLRLDYQLINDLKLSFITSYVQGNERETEFRSNQKLSSLTIGPNFLREYNSANYYYTLQGLAEYTKQIGNHQVGVLAGYSFEDFKRENFNAFRDNFPGNDLTVLNVGSPLNQQANGTGSENALESQFARATYSYANKYLLEGVVRRDGSSRFPTGNKYAVFPSVAAGWRIGQEQFVQKLAPWISELKLKASYGVLGNQNIGNYQYQNTLSQSNANASGTNYSFGGQIVQGVARTTLVDTTLRWESTRTKDIGLEVAILKNKLNFSATYFDRYTYDILYSPSASVSGVLGFGLSQRNTGSLENTGWEFTLGHQNTVGKFSYSLKGNFSIINNKVLDLGVGNIVQPNGLVGNGSSLFIGHPMDIYYGYVADGLFVDQADIDSWANMKAVNPSAKPGDIRYKDISGPEGVPDGIVDATYDRKVLGSQIPKYTFGANLGASYGGFDLSVLLQGISEVTGRLQDYAGWALFNTTGNIQRWQYEGRWTDQNPNRNAIYPRLENVPDAGTNNTILSSFWTLDGSYLRIKNVQLGYKLPTLLTEKVKIANARFYLSGENMHTFSNYRKGWDPELIGNADFYPIMAVYTLGLNVTF
ncbi:SusC/RagA family TonB-linked outer membrane protein [Rufibacter soli]